MSLVTSLLLQFWNCIALITLAEPASKTLQLLRQFGDPVPGAVHSAGGLAERDHLGKAGHQPLQGKDATLQPSKERRLALLESSARRHLLPDQAERELDLALGRVQFRGAKFC